jgi:hypothetical protein
MPARVVKSHYPTPGVAPATPTLRPANDGAREGSAPYDRLVEQVPAPEGIDVVGPVRADVYLVWLHGDQIEITGPDGPKPWIVQLDETEHPVAAVERIVAGLVGPPLLIHSTSWRREGSALILSFVAVIAPEQVGTMSTRGVRRAELARSEATRAPGRIGDLQVLEHGLRHLAWLAADDAVVAGLLSAGWHAALTDYVPEPFRSFA